MAETPTSSVPDPASGVPAAPTPSEPAPALEPVAATESVAATDPLAAPDPVVPPEPVTPPEPPVVTAAIADAEAALEDAPAVTAAAPAAAEPAVPVAAPPAAEAPPSPAVVAEVALEALDPGEPRVAATLEVPPLPAGASGSAARAEGGEWELLLGKVQAWLEQADLPGQWERLGGPLRGLGVLLGLLLVLKLYVALLDTLDDLLLLPRLLQLVGLIALLRFSVTRLTRSSDRQVILEDWKRRWDDFRGV